MCFGSFNTLLDEKIYSVKCEYVKDEKENNYSGVKDEMTSDKIVENVVGGSVATHQEHIIVVDYFVSYHRTGAEGKENKEGEGDVFLLHASHIGKCNVERTETGNRMSYDPYHDHNSSRFNGNISKIIKRNKFLCLLKKYNKLSSTV